MAYSADEGQRLLGGGDKAMRHKGVYLHGISARKGERQNKGSTARVQKSKGAAVQCSAQCEVKQGKAESSARQQEARIVVFFFFGGGFVRGIVFCTRKGAKFPRANTTAAL